MIGAGSAHNIWDNKIKQRSHLDLSAAALNENKLYTPKYNKRQYNTSAIVQADPP